MDNLLLKILCYVSGLSFGRCFGIDANNRFGIGFPKMHPLVFKMNFYPIYGIYILDRIDFGDSLKNPINIGSGCEGHFFFNHKKLGVGRPQLRYGNLSFGEQRQEKCYAH